MADLTQNPDKIIEKVLLDTIVEQRRKRRWGIFFKFIFLAIIAFLVFSVSPWADYFNHESISKKKHIAQISLIGEINATGDINAPDAIEALDTAADDKQTQAIILDINSPGGSPVQSSYIYNEIRRLQQVKKIPIDVVCEDICASGGYYIASAGDHIYANPTSLIGSIGVLMDGFGFVDTMKKVGADRRLFTAGKYKGFLDPFSPVKPKEVGFVHDMLESDHQVFIQDVKAGRGDRLKDDPNMFTGLVWNGVQAKQLGLIDGFGSVADIARTKYYNDNIVDYTLKPNVLQKIFAQFGATFWHKFRTEFSGEQLS